MTVAAKRAYEAPLPGDGRRYLIDRLWPRGVRKEKLLLTDWLKELGPSDELRTWFGHVPAKYRVFRQRYRRELTKQTALLTRLTQEARADMVTLVFSARDVDHCNATVLKELLEERIQKDGPARSKTLLDRE
ncbi:MAG: DUF488 domain-containing protein [Thermoplasmata archaeon]